MSGKETEISAIIAWMCKDCCYVRAWRRKIGTLSKATSLVKVREWKEALRIQNQLSTTRSVFAESRLDPSSMFVTLSGRRLFGIEGLINHSCRPGFRPHTRDSIPRNVL